MKKFDYQNYLIKSPIVKGKGVYLFTKNILLAKNKKKKINIYLIKLLLFKQTSIRGNKI